MPVTVTPCGQACKHPGSGQNDKTYHFTFCFQTNTALDGGVVYLDTMTINGVTKPVTSPTTVTITAGAAPYCIYVDVSGYDNSANGLGTLAFHYFIAGVRFDGTVQTDANDLPTCGTADGGVNPQNYPHPLQGPPAPVNCVT